MGDWILVSTIKENAQLLKPEEILSCSSNCSIYGILKVRSGGEEEGMVKKGAQAGCFDPICSQRAAEPLAPLPVPSLFQS